MRSTAPILHLLALPAVALAIGCASTKTAPPAADPPTTTGEMRVEKPAPSGEVTMRTAAPVKLEPVYFDTDRALLRPEAREALQQQAKSISEHPEWGVVTIEGHCDERGSTEYNLALGQRRADAVRRYLVDLGVAPSRLDMLTLGEEKPAVAGHDESAWRFNRRSEMRRGSQEQALR